LFFRKSRPALNRPLFKGIIQPYHPTFSQRYFRLHLYLARLALALAQVQVAAQVVALALVLALVVVVVVVLLVLVSALAVFLAHIHFLPVFLLLDIPHVLV
jgi:hypothetical protein